MATIFPVKFTADGLQDVLKASTQVKKSYLDWLESAEKAIAETNKAAEQFANDQQKLAQLEKQKTRAAQDANRAISASYRELGIKSSKSIEEAKNRAIAAYEALKKSGVASTRDLEIAAKRLDQRLESLDNELKDVDKSARDAGGGFTVMKGAIAGIVANLATNLFQNTIQSLTGLVTGSIKTRAELSKLRDQLSLLEGGDAKGALAFDKISEFAKTTPFEIDEVTQAYVALGNRGIKPTFAQLTKLGDLALSQNKSLNQLVEAVLDAQTGENERLKEFGVRAEKNGDRVKFAFKGITKEVELTEKAVLEALVSFGGVDGVAGSIEKAANRLDGVGSNISDSFTRIKDALGGALEPLLITAGKGLVEFLGPLSDPALWAPLQDALAELFSVFTAAGPAAEELRQAVADGLVGAVQVLSVLILDIADTLRENPAIIQQSVDTFKTLIVIVGGVITLLALVVDGLIKITGAITTAAVIFRDTFLGAIAETPAAWDAAIGGIQATWDSFVSDLRLQWQSTVNFLVATWQVVYDAIIKFAEFATGLWPKIQAAAELAIGVIQGKTENLLGPWGKILDIALKVIGALNSWVNPIERALKPLREFSGILLKILGQSEKVGEDTGEKLEKGTGGPLLAAPNGSFSPMTFPVTSPYGMRGGRLHAGTDYGTPEGTPLANIFGPGVVTYAGEAGAYGNLLELTLATGEVYRFGHLSGFTVRQGQVVPAGALMGFTGNTGRSSGPHLHLEYYPRGLDGGAVDFEGRGFGFGSGFNALGAASGRGGPFAMAGASTLQGAAKIPIESRIQRAQGVVAQAGRLVELAGLETQFLLGQARQGAAAELEIRRIEIERQIVEEQAELAQKLARLQLDRVEASGDADQVEYIDNLIERYSALNELSLKGLTSELQQLDAAAQRAEAKTPALKEIAKVATDSLRQIPGLLIGVITGTKSLGDTVLGFIGSLASQIGEMFLDKGFSLLDGLIGGLFAPKGGGSGRGNGLFGAGISGLLGGAKFSRGVVLPGYGGGDRIPALLEPGEAVLRKELVRAIGGGVLSLANANPSLSMGNSSFVTTNNNQRHQNITVNYLGGDSRGARLTHRQMTNDLAANLQRNR